MSCKRTTPTVLLATSIIWAGLGCTEERARGEGPPADEGDDEAHGPELPGLSETLWTERTELFMEHRPLIVGREVGFAAHVTEMPSFKPVTEGSVTLVLTMADGTSLTGRADKPSSPGIFRPVLTAAKVGECKLEMSIEGPMLRDRFLVGPCKVFEDQEAALIALEDESEASGRITFLKEQQWKTDFATLAAGARELQPSVHAQGEIRPAAGKEARLSAATSGRVSLSTPPPVLGDTVTKGQVLAVIAPRLSAGGDRASLVAEVEAARAELEAAQVQRKRAERLFAEKAIPERGLEEAKTRAAIAEARFGAANGRLAQYRSGASGSGTAGSAGFQVRSPIEGTLVFADVASGETVEEGKHLFTVIDLEKVWLQARVFEPDIPKVESARSAWFTIEGYEEPFVVDETNGKLVTVGRVIDPTTRTVVVIFEVDNKGGKLRIGQFAKVGIASDRPIRAVALPEAAVIEDGGKPIAFVQAEGEAFERRLLKLGIRDQGWIQILEGVTSGEHVVTKGAYEIKLAAASGTIPAHGHAH